MNHEPEIPASAPTGRRSRASEAIPVSSKARMIPLVIASVWLAASVAAGLAVASPAWAADDQVPLAATSKAQSFQGDAYTGIQNTSSATEHAVVAGFNAMLDDQRDVTRRWGVGLAMVIIGVGLTNFTLVLQRFLATPRRM